MTDSDKLNFLMHAMVELQKENRRIEEQGFVTRSRASGV
jgi:hypothetical protein